MESRLKIVMFATLRVVVALVLALFTTNWIAHRVCECPTVFHRELGRIPRPGSEFRWQIEGHGHGMWTSNCVRRTSWPESVSNNILVLGDSYTEALHVTDEEHFAHRLESRLATGGFHSAVLSVGKSGWSGADYVAKAPTFKRLFNPSWVIIQAGDDDFGADAWDKTKPPNCAYFHRDSKTSDLKLWNRPPPDTTISGRVNDRMPYFLPLVLFAQDRSQVIKSWLKDNSQPWFHAEAAPASGNEDRKGQLTEYPVAEELRMLSDAFDHHVTILYLPRFEPETLDRETANEIHLKEAATSAGIHFVSLRKRFPALAQSGHVPYGFANTRFNRGHWNRDGHEAAAELLFEDCQSLRHALH